MRKAYIKLLIITLLATSLTFPGIQGQTAPKIQGLSLKVSPGALSFYGEMSQNDLNPVIKIGQSSKFGIGLGLLKQFSPGIGIQVQFLTGSLYSLYTTTDPLTSTYFSGSLTDFGLQLRVDPIRFFNPYVKFSPYVGVGISTIQYRSVRRLVNGNTIIWPAYGYGLDGVTKKPAIPAMSVPITLGLSYRILPQLDVELEHSLRLTNNDLLDCLKGTTNVNDYYSLTSLGVRYTLSGKSTPAERKTARTTKEPSAKPAKTRSETIRNRTEEPVTKTEEPKTRNARTIVEPEKEVAVFNYDLPEVDVFIECEVPENVQTGRLFEVKFKISKGNYKGPAKLIQKFADGFSALEIQSIGSTFSFMNQTVLIEWDQMPSDSIVTYSYHAKAGESLSGSLTITGRFEYQQPAGPRTIRFNKTVFVDNRTEDLMDRKFKEIIGEGDAPITRKTETVTDISSEQRIDQLLKQYGDNPVSRTTGAVTKTGTNIKPAQPVQGVEFRVQIAAFRDRSQAASQLASKYAITETIQEEYHDGWYKYTVQSFKTYDEAARFRDSFIQRSKIWSAFIVAYRNGQRLARVSDAYR